MKLFAALAMALAAAIVVPFLALGPRGTPPAAHLPWLIEALPDGRSKVIGLTLPESTFEQARTLLGDAFDIALLVAGDGHIDLEAHLERASLGYITGRLILGLTASDAQLQAMAGRATKSEPTRSGLHRLHLAARDVADAGQLRIRAITFAPSVDLDEKTLVDRFGDPQGRLEAGAEATHLLYPAKGLAILLDRRGKELLQYVAPRDFAALAAMLGTPASPGAQ